MPNRHTTLTSLFTDIAGAIRSKTGDSAEIKADDFDTAIEAIPSGGGGYTAEQVLGLEPIDSFTYDGTSLDSYALYKKTINNLSLPNLTKINSNALAYANVSSDLSTLFSKVEEMYSYGLSYFNRNIHLVSDYNIYFQKLKYIEYSSFNNFGGGSSNDYKYSNYNNPKYNIIMPSLTSTAVTPCANVNKVRNLSARNWMGAKNICDNGQSLGTIDIKGWDRTPNSSSGTNCLVNYGKNLRTIVIRNNSKMCPASSNPKYMWGTGSNIAYFMTGTVDSIYNPNGEHGVIYVPDNLVDTYKNDANWQACFDVNYIKPLSEYVDPYESYYQQA